MLDYRSVTFGSLFFRGALSWRSEDMEDPPMWSSGHISRNLSHSPQEHVKANKPANKFPEANASGKKTQKNNSSEFSEWVPLGQKSPTSTYPSMTCQFEVKGTVDIISGFLWPPVRVRLRNSTMHHLGFGLKHSAGHQLNRNLTLEVKEPKTSLPSPSHQYCLVKMYMHTRNPNDPCFDWKGPCFGGLTFKNRGHLGSRYMNTLNRSNLKQVSHMCLRYRFNIRVFSQCPFARDTANQISFFGIFRVA